MYALGEQVGSGSDGSTSEVGASYASGPFSIGAAYGNEKGIPVAAKAASFTLNTATGTIDPVAATAAVPALDSKQWTIGGAYKANPFEIMIGYDKDTTDVNGGGDNDRKVSWIGGRYAMSGANAVSLAYYHDKRDNAGVQGTKKLWIVGFVHNMSKRTELYFDIDNAKVDGSLKTTDDTNTGISVGINHAF